MPDPVVAIVGRPNVGKSSLFNRILGRRHAIVSDVAGTTRDRLMAEVSWDDHAFILVDTGGLETNPEGEIREKVQEQAQMAMDDANVIIFLTDVTDGLAPTDQIVADQLRKTEKPVILAVNKVDNEAREFIAAEFYQLGIENTVLISAYHNFGIHDLMERVVSYLPSPPSKEDQEEPGEATLKLAIVGRTNVGKSMLLNAILGQERSIVSEVAGTTRDALDTNMIYAGHQVVLIDTAGIRRPGQVESGIEKYSVIRAVNAVSRSDIALLVTDAAELATAQDAHITGLVWDLCRGLIVVVNKWDLMASPASAYPDVSDTRHLPRGETTPPDPPLSSGYTQEPYTMDQAAEVVRKRLHFMPYVPICFTSALHVWGVEALMQTTLALWRERLRHVPTNQLQYMLAGALASHAPPPGKRQQRLRIDRLRQVGVNPPTFIFSVNNPELVHFSYQRYLENQIRTTFGFDHTHLKLVFQRQR